MVIPIKLEFSASVGFIHKEFVTMHGHMILEHKVEFFVGGGELFRSGCFAIFNRSIVVIGHTK